MVCVRREEGAGRLMGTIAVRPWQLYRQARMESRPDGMLVLRSRGRDELGSDAGEPVGAREPPVKTFLHATEAETGSPAD